MPGFSTLFPFFRVLQTQFSHRLYLVEHIALFVSMTSTICYLLESHQKTTFVYIFNESKYSLKGRLFMQPTVFSLTLMDKYTSISMSSVHELSQRYLADFENKFPKFINYAFIPNFLFITFLLRIFHMKYSIS